MVRYTQDGSQFSTVIYSEREGVLIHTGIQTLREKANREAGYERGAMLHLPTFYWAWPHAAIPNFLLSISNDERAPIAEQIISSWHYFNHSNLVPESSWCTTAIAVVVTQSSQNVAQIFPDVCLRMHKTTLHWHKTKTSFLQLSI